MIVADSHIDKKTQANEDSNETVVAEAAVNPEPAQTSAAKEQASDTSSRAKSAASKAVRATTGTAKKAASRVADGVKSAAVSAAKNAKEAEITTRTSLYWNRTTLPVCAKC